MKYIADNALEDENTIPLCDCLVRSSAVLASNLLGDASCHFDEDCQQKLINSAYNVMAICEAIASKGTTEQREEALKKARKTFSRESLAKE